MAKRLMMTSFTTWKPEQTSNSSDDLMLAMLDKGMVSPTQVVRLLPVHFEEAPRRAIDYFNTFQPDGVVCFGMAEKRDRLNLERQAVREDHTRQTRLPLESWLEELSFTDISDDAGKFVCNHLYYELLDYVQQHHPEKFVLFIHVPVLTAENKAAILQDIQVIMGRLHAIPAGSPQPIAPVTPLLR
ncbi:MULTISPECIES: peptidase C15 [unclassified Leptolyngbya]|uniref:pyroglutamyl-peptidase I family protein n=1 Tax=unclassified Leptolyngbya TaxID=2650499 RepID=UPI00168859D9|nr:MULTISPECIES: peptidase C15 [unclassified Leptolyngbya]MBD1913507.1 peptidase C15 [Leptolyngbya sp. FACHB-8]MBD2153271.1 peptidase C15 [Leptolyngbya sp. FACHB-16]